MFHWNHLKEANFVITISFTIRKKLAVSFARIAWLLLDQILYSSKQKGDIVLKNKSDTFDQLQPFIFHFFVMATLNKTEIFSDRLF